MPIVAGFRYVKMSVMKHLILFGDSHFGRFGQKKILNLENKVRTTKALDINVYNIAAGGMTSRDCVRKAEYIAKLNAEYVCISLGVNDCNPFKNQTVTLDEFRENMRNIISAFSHSINLDGEKTKVIIFPCPPVFDANDMEGTNKFNALLVQYNETLTKEIVSVISTNKDNDINIIVIDTRAVYTPLIEAGTIFHDTDGLHLNEVGYSIMTEELVKVI